LPDQKTSRQGRGGERGNQVEEGVKRTSQSKHLLAGENDVGHPAERGAIQRRDRYYGVGEAE